MPHIPARIRPFPNPFPPEVTDAVIDQLHSDINSLRACALTSSSWLPTSRYHLFNDVCFEDEASVFRWTQVFSVSSVIPSYVANLHISCLSLLDDFESNVTLDLPTFTGLKGLFIGGSDVISARPRRLNRHCFRRIALFPSGALQTFSLSSPVIPILDVFSVVRNLPRLDNIHLRCFTTLTSDGVGVINTEASPPLSGTLILASHASYGPFVVGLLGFPGGIRFSCLKFASLRDDELPNLRLLVDACSHTITSLRITIDRRESHLPFDSVIQSLNRIAPQINVALPVILDGESSYLFDLSECHKLSELHVTLHAMGFPAKAFVKMLSSIANAQSRLQHLKFSLFTWRVWKFRDHGVGWDAVDMKLVELSQTVRERTGVDLVIQVTVNLLEYGPHDVRDILPRSGEKGLVRLVRDGDSTLELLTLAVGFILSSRPQGLRLMNNPVALSGPVGVVR